MSSSKSQNFQRKPVPWLNLTCTCEKSLCRCKRFCSTLLFSQKKKPYHTEKLLQDLFQVMVRINRQGKFQQVLGLDASRQLELVPVWYIELPATELSGMLAKLKESLPAEPFDLAHIRRIVKLDTSEDKGILLRLLVCSQGLVPESTVQELVGSHELHSARVSKYQADTKEESAQWSQESGWPISWRGNPAAVLPVLSPETQKQMEEWVERIAKSDRVRALVVNPVTNELLADECEQKTTHPLNHAVMRAIQAVAERERQAKRGNPESENYLCLDMDVYTTDEPCTMCSMALVHSRIGRLIYIRQSTVSGAIDPSSQLSYGLHGRPQLNHTFQVWQCHLEG